jgi:hypothetical protein
MFNSGLPTGFRLETEVFWIKTKDKSTVINFARPFIVPIEKEALIRTAGFGLIDWFAAMGFIANLASLFGFQHCAAKRAIN